MPEPTVHDAEVARVREVVVHHHVRLVDLAAALDGDAAVNVLRRTEVVPEGPVRVPHDEVVLEITDDGAVEQLLGMSHVPRSRRMPPRTALEELLAVVAELERELAVRRRVYPRWVSEGRISASASSERTARMSQAVALLRELAEHAPGAQPDLFDSPRPAAP